MCCKTHVRYGSSATVEVHYAGAVIYIPAQRCYFNKTLATLLPIHQEDCVICVMGIAPISQRPCETVFPTVPAVMQLSKDFRKSPHVSVVATAMMRAVGSALKE